MPSSTELSGRGLSDSFPFTKNTTPPGDLSYTIRILKFGISPGRPRGKDSRAASDVRSGHLVRSARVKVLFEIILASLLDSLVSFVGIIFFAAGFNIRRITFYLISLASG